MAYTEKIAMVEVKDLKPYAKNAKKHDKEQVEKIAESIKRFGFVSPCLIDGEKNIIAGHGRLMAAKKLGMQAVPCVFVEGMTDEERRAYILADNRLTEIGGWDMGLVRDEIAALIDAGFDVGVLGFDDVLGNSDKDVSEDDFDIDNPVDIRCRAGDVWKLGDHRLMCGDSTNVDCVQRLMGGEKADLFLTDPPYNVDYTGGTKDKLKIMNDKQEDGAFRAFLTDAFVAADSVLREGGGYYVWHADSEGLNFRAAARSAGWTLRQTIIWVKNSIVLGRQDYQWKHEPCLYGWKDGTHYFTQDRAQATVWDDKVDIKKLKKDELMQILTAMLSDKAHTTVIYEDKPTRNDLHPTMKPVRLIGRLIANSTMPGWIVLDTFAGSGSTLIACEQLNRRCYMMELDPHYCDVIIARWEALTGREAVLEKED